MKDNYLSALKAGMLTTWEIIVGKMIFSEQDNGVAVTRLALSLFGIRREERLPLNNWETFETFS